MLKKRVLGNFVITVMLIVAVMVSCNTHLQFEPEMVLVEGGTFMMGQDGDERTSPVHQVTLSNFKIGKYPVTQGQWVAVMGNNSSHFQKGDDYPVENVSWIDVQDFITKLNQLTSKKYRLPTKAEWEYAARGGNKSKGYIYSGSNNINEVAWYYGNNKPYSPYGTKTVGTKAPNELGIYDMTGNVCEMCNDWYGHYSVEAQVNPMGPSEGTDRVVHGCGWYYLPVYSHIAMRIYLSDSPNSIKGFRLVLP